MLQRTFTLALNSVRISSQLAKMMPKSLKGTKLCAIYLSMQISDLVTFFSSKNRFLKPSSNSERLLISAESTKMEMKELWPVLFSLSDAATNRSNRTKKH